ncbi:hypothetical protein Acr_25g0001040 [Actinidia rufa]|uniref:Uncharacterized protein n=1 Tax=Actinidia rufa TaxID=165716 RepID=A0A7J0GXZ1_9ERIC|nr:hypothetical protein Acr_25g0001040 [Actinidia rufa]
MQGNKHGCMICNGVEPLGQAEMTSLQYYFALATLRKHLDHLADNTAIYQVPSLREAFFIIQNEESCRGVMLPPIPSELSALVSVPQSEHRNQPTHRDSGFSVGSDDKDKLHCDYCQRPHHTRETCWHLHGRPPTRGRCGRSGSAGGRGGSSRAHHSTVVESPFSGSESIVFSTIEIELLRSMMS